MDKKPGSEYCNCLYFSANALSRAITRLAEEVFAETGLAPSYAFLLMTVNQNPGIQPTGISRKMMLMPSTVTRLIEKMESKGFLERRIKGKFTEVFPTSKSLELDAKIRDAWAGLYKKYSDVLGEKRSSELALETFVASKKLEP